MIYQGLTLDRDREFFETIFGEFLVLKSNSDVKIYIIEQK